ncbi:luciferin 4-monooxygenase-like [Coccinella septempunctata]|uniref:luciferin 4-monooxygenase-like n=1 Tax=Coccinella septempunctata TaxID=41139 RepID=UPI001D088612|nr:luciferin 4-monooxygenase-like [Coccinella septempunctata]
MNKDPVILHGPELLYEPGRGGLGFELYRSLQLHKDKIGRYIIETGESCTHGDIFVRSKKLAIYLKSKNLKKDDVVCLCSQNQIHSTVPFFAAKFIDVGYASIEPTMAEEDLVYLFEYIKPKVLFVAENVEEKIGECLVKSNIQAEVIIIGNCENKLSLEKIVSQTVDEEFTPVIIENLKETAVLFFSSGTTGKPKGICCNHYSLLSKIINIGDQILDTGSFNLSNFTLTLSEDSYSNTLTYSPMYWISGISLVIMATLHGSILTIGATFDSETLWGALKKYKPTVVFLPPGQVTDIYLKWKENSYEVNDNLKLFVTGGGPVRPYHLDYMEQMFPKAYNFQMLGLTEATGLITLFSVKDPKSKVLQKKYPESCGQVAAGISIKIVDVDTEELCGYNQQGELRINTKLIMNGYYKMDSSSCFDQDGWFKTGDLAYINEEDCLVIVDRLKDILLYTVYNIRTSVIEDILAQHPSVHECCVIGIPHPEDNEHPMGVVKLKNGFNGKTTSEEILDFFNQRVPSDRYKIRAGVKLVNEIVKTPTGKIKKVAMKKLILENQL